MGSIACGWRRLAATTALAWAAVCNGTTQPPIDAASAMPVQVLTAAEFALHAQGPWQRVALPDTWRQRGIAPHQIGYYRTRFELPHPPRLPLAVRIDRLSRVHEVRVNGQLAQGKLGQPETVLRRPTPALVVLPPALLRQGENLLEVVVDADAQAGLSPMIVGLQDDLDEGFLFSYHRSTTLPQYLNLAAFGIALFMLLLWLRRRSDPALGLFAGLSLLASGRNVAYFNSAPMSSTALTDALFFSLQAATVVLLGFFALHHAALRGPAAQRARTVLWAVLVAYPVLGSAASFSGLTHQARGWLYPGLIVVALGALAILFRAALIRRTVLDSLLMVSFALVLVAGVHDYLYQQGHSSVMDGYWLPFATPAALLVYTGGLLGRLVQALHASERHAQELERRVAERAGQLQAAHAARLRYLAAASHDLRQPLVSIGLLGSLLGQQPLQASGAATLTQLQGAVREMDDLFDRLLTFSRLEAAAVLPRLQALPVQPLLNAAQAYVEAVAQAQGLRLRMRATSAVVRADRTLLEQILRNLVGNALRYTVSGAVLVAVRPHGEGWRLEVRDSGPGIAPQDHRRIFEEFVRLPQPVSSATRSALQRDAGLGLGLAIAQRQAQLLGSRIELASAPGCGSRFWLVLPRG